MGKTKGVGKHTKCTLVNSRLFYRIVQSKMIHLHTDIEIYSSVDLKKIKP